MVRRDFLLAPHFWPATLRSRFEADLHFFMAVSIWGFHVSLRSYVTPRNLACLSTTRGVPRIVRLISFCRGSDDLVNSTAVVLLSESLKPHWSVQAVTLSRCF